MWFDGLVDVLSMRGILGSHRKRSGSSAVCLSWPFKLHAAGPETSSGGTTLSPLYNTMRFLYLYHELYKYT